MRPKSGYDSSDSISLRGEEGLLGGETVSVSLGESVVVGRSRRCDLSTRRSRAFLDATEEEQRLILKNRSFLRVSRQHVRVTFLGVGHVEVWDLSRNGTFVDGRKVDRIFLDVNGDDGFELLLADSERLHLAH